MEVVETSTLLVVEGALAIGEVFVLLKIVCLAVVEVDLVLDGGSSCSTVLVARGNVGGVDALAIVGLPVVEVDFEVDALLDSAFAQN